MDYEIIDKYLIYPIPFPLQPDSDLEDRMIQSLNRLLDIRRPQRRPDSIGKRKYNRHKRYRLKYKRRHTKPTYTQHNIN